VLPKPGTPEQAELIADEEGIADESYLETIRTFDPQADQLYDEVARHAVAGLDAVGRRSDLRVLDLAAGTALEVHALLNHDVGIRELVLTDFSRKVLETAHRMLSRVPAASAIGETVLLPFDLLAESVTAKVTPGFDLVMSCNSFMHFGKQDHQRIFRDVHDVMEDQGVFVFESHFRIMERDWKNVIITATQQRMLSRGQDRAFVETVGSHYARFHQFHAMHDIYNWLEQAGFGYFDCVYRNRMLGIFVAIK
jgi:SAM-dependent methyltransferase